MRLFSLPPRLGAASYFNGRPCASARRRINLSITLLTNGAVSIITFSISTIDAAAVGPAAHDCGPAPRDLGKDALMDKRIKHTKAALKNSFIKLLNDRPLSRITVSDICREADVNRSTYYSHYLDPFDQFEQIRNDFFSGMSSVMDVFAEDMDRDLMLRATRLVCQYYYDNRDTYLAIKRADSGLNYLSASFGSLKDVVFKRWRSGGIPRSEKDMGYILPYVLAGCDCLLYRWLSDGESRDSLDDISALLVKVTYEGIYGFS